MGIKKFWDLWTSKRSRYGDPQSLTSKTIYILPSKFGWAYGFVLLTLFTGAINYQISTVFLMTFLLVIVSLVSAWESHENLKNLSIKFISLDDAQQGTPALLTLFIHASSRIRLGCEFQIGTQPPIRLETIPAEGLQFIVPIETSQRGCFPLPRITISSFFPFGIFKVWGYAYFNELYFVYPKPINPGFWPPPHSNENNKRKDTPGEEEFYDLKQVDNPWFQPNLIAWKIAAKNQGWYIKRQDSSEGDYWLFKLNDLPIKDLESQLEHLSYWLQTAESNGYLYGLSIAQSQTELTRGVEHLQHCLRQLALYQ